MGSHSSKAAKGEVMAQDAVAADASPSKSNGQENGHVKINGDVSPKADGEATPLNGNGSAEPVKEEVKEEAGSGDAIEPAPVAEGGEAKPDGSAGTAASKEAPKKKKKFSFKKSFKLSGISFRKTKKEAGDASAASSPSEEQGKVEVKGEENPACAAGEMEQESASKEEASPVAPVEAAAPECQQEVEAKEGEASEGQAKEEKQQPLPATEGQDDTKPGEASKPAEAEPSSAPAEQKEE
ncbi:MARCKS-related protein [Rhineura floridana]|uniref:MARCKS-related protein n=1 Tax=Rhineura floridana TaxID=261503 RepID=UPI002AC8067B|nr:MARCKS-related protein [Rhineura floridana]